MTEKALEKIKALESHDKLLQLALRNEKLPILTKEGYYLSPSFLSEINLTFLLNILSDWNDDNRMKFDLFISEYIENNISIIQQKILESVPDRREIINCIFELYKSKNIIAIIPLILSQTDGIIKNITKKNGFYSNLHGKKGTLTSLRLLDDNFYINYFSQFDQLHFKDRNEYELFKQNIDDMTKFNRHSILHGQSKDFGTQINLIKSILLFSFIADLNRANK